MFPYQTSFKLNRALSQPLYLQLSLQFIRYIKERQLASNTKLMGTRSLSKVLRVHRKTVVACYEELALQGWVVSIPKKGTFVNSNLPLLENQFFTKNTLIQKNEIGFDFYNNEALQNPNYPTNDDLVYLNDGISDSRLTPIHDISRSYRRIAGRRTIHKALSYGSTFGNMELRKTLVTYLNETRGLHITEDNILITRGSQMGIYLASQLLLKKNDIIIVGDTNYATATTTFMNHGARILTVPVDANGIDTNAVEVLCIQHSIRALYITSHHHHPTTVTLSAERRIHLLNLAKAYGFALIEDDYDYDFNYNHAPILPLASHDMNGNVVYIGSVCKTVAPVFRIGYFIGPKTFVSEASKLRRYIDRQGDALLELTFEDFIRSGDLDRHIRKVLRIYKHRRDLFCQLLEDKCGNVFSFEVPKGGMAVWVALDKEYSWDTLRTIAKTYQLIVPDYRNYDLFDIKHNAIRIGFATYTDSEMHQLVDLLSKTVKRLKLN